MLFLVNDILDYGQIEAKQIVINNEPVNILLLLNECKSMMTFQASTKALEIIVEVDVDFPDKVQTDPNRIKQIIINLLSNSIKYTNRGGFIKLKAMKFDKFTYQI